ncbi:hypothetical protein DPMN_168064 [Dreissena polymorpha]|uniref:C2H2-type domain-containing protein n=1 Tax=Dreissena polymorpha TaxID=45954 RepID=A0A9D4IWW4_DREPO|nr:hypothetical protein DPMN_168064 [Dreissena polymorpha]
MGVQERMEKAHSQVRKNTGLSMKRQKVCYYARVSYESFELGEKVYVLFPVEKSGCSSKLTSFLRGPFEVRAKLSPLLYRVNCGQNKGEQVIHCDRLHKVRPQILDGEIEDNAGGPRDLPVVREEDLDVPNNKRSRRRPIWADDYVLYAFREMPNTKTTPRTQTEALVCPKCKESCEDSSACSYHIRVCMEEQVGCDKCRISLKTRKKYQQHVRRVHQSLYEDWLQEDPGDLIEDPDFVTESVKPVVTEETAVIKVQIKPQESKEASAVRDSAKPANILETLAVIRKHTKPVLPGPHVNQSLQQSVKGN